MNLRFTVEAEGLPEGKQKKFQEIYGVLNLTNLNIKQKMLQNEEKDAVKAMANIKLDVAEPSMNIGTSVWIEAVLSEENFKLVQIIKIPDFIKLLLSIGGLPPKEYILYDIKDVIGEIQGDTNVSSIYCKDASSKVKALQESFLKSFNPGFKVVKYKGQKLYYGEKLDIYKVMLDDAYFKKLLRNFVSYSLDNEEVLELLKEYFKLVMKVAAFDKDENQPELEELFKGFGGIEELLSVAKIESDAFMKGIEDVRIIGDKGIVIEYAVNNEGYIVRKNGDINLEINLTGLSKAPDSKKPEEKESEVIIKINLKFDSKSFNINEDIEIEIPIVNEDNSFNILDFL